MHKVNLSCALAITLACIMPQHSSFAQSNDAPLQGADSITAAPNLTPETCRAQLEAQRVTFAFTEPVAEGDCIIPLPVKLQSQAIGDNIVAFGAAPVLDCRLALRLTDWLSNVVEPLASHHLKSGLASVETGPGYACRNQNNAASAKLSEHAKGNAIDIAAFALRDGSRIPVRPADRASEAVAAFLTAIRITACGYFLTTLGPGSDAAHAEHLHLDLRSRKAGYRICQ